MRFQTTILCAVLLAALMAGAAQARRAAVPAAATPASVTAGSTAPLTLSVAEGAAPLRVTITGPQVLLDMIAACKRRVGWITPGFSILWGDGANDPEYMQGARRGESCAEVHTHSYSVPGDYTIKATTYHLGPTDAAVTDWSGSAQIRVTGVAPAGAVQLKLLNISDGQTFYYQAMPRVEWMLNTNARVDVVSELLARDGSVVESAITKDRAYSGEGDAYLSQTTADYDAALRRKAGPYVLRVRAMQGEQVLAQAEARNLTISPEMQGNFANWTIEPRSGLAPLAVTLTYPHFHKECFSYRIDWGDKSEIAQLTQPIKTGCKLEQGVLQLEHTYAKPGTYRIIMRTNNISPFTKMDDILPYEAAEIVVGR